MQTNAQEFGIVCAFLFDFTISLPMLLKINRCYMQEIV